MACTRKGISLKYVRNYTLWNTDMAKKKYSKMYFDLTYIR